MIRDARRAAVLCASLPLTFSFSAPQSPSSLLSRPPALPSSLLSRQQAPPSSLQLFSRHPSPHRTQVLRLSPSPADPLSPAYLSAPLTVPLSSPHRHHTENASFQDPQSPQNTPGTPARSSPHKSGSSYSPAANASAPCCICSARFGTL